jgi:ribosomal protein L24
MAVHRLHVRKNDQVIVVAGKEKGKTGKVLRVFPEKGRVLVENLNVVKRHTRPVSRLGPECECLKTAARCVFARSVTRQWTSNGESPWQD